MYQLTISLLAHRIHGSFSGVGVKIQHNNVWGGAQSHHILYHSAMHLPHNPHSLAPRLQSSAFYRTMYKSQEVQ